MTSSLSQSAAAEAARRAALEAARRRAQELARKAAEEAARRAAAAAAAKAAAQKAVAVKKPFADELSTGRGSALKNRGLAAAGSQLIAAPVQSDNRRFSVSELLAAAKKGNPVQASTLATERLNDGQENCLELAVEAARPGDQIVLADSKSSPVGHALVQRQDGTVTDPQTRQEYASLEAWKQANPEFKNLATVSDRDAERVLKTAPGAQRDAVIAELGLTGIADKVVARDWTPDFVDDVVEEVVETGGDIVEGAAEAGGEFIEAVGGTVDDFVDGVVPQEVQDALGHIPAADAVLHAGQTLEDLGQTLQDLPELVDTIREAASYRARIEALGPGDSFTLNAEGGVAAYGITGELSGEVQIRRTDDGKYVLRATGEIGLGGGGPLGNGAEASGTATLGGGVEFEFDSVEDAKRGMDILMANVVGRSGVLGEVADQTGVTERIFGASNDDLSELTDNQSASVLTLGTNTSAKLTGQAGLSANFGTDAEARVRVEYDENGEIDRVVLQAQYKGTAGGSASEGPNGVSGSASGTVLVEQGFTVPEGMSLTDILADPTRLTREPDAKITLTADVQGGSSRGAGGGGVSAALKENEGVQAKAVITGNPAEILNSGVVGQVLEGDFDGALDALETTDLNIQASVRRYTSDGVSADGVIGEGGNGVTFGVGAENKDFETEPLFEFDGGIADIRRGFDDVQRQIARNAEDYGYLAPILA